MPRRGLEHGRDLAAGKPPSPADSADESGSRAADRRDWAARPPAPCCGASSPMRGRLAIRCARVGVQRIAEHLARRRLLHQPARIHDAEPVGQMACTPMSWVTNRIEEPISRCSSRIMPSTSFCTSDVQRGGRLVGDDEIGPADGGQRDGDALAHAAGQLVRIGVEHRRARGCSRARCASTTAAGIPARLPPCAARRNRRNDCRTRRTGFSTFIEPCMM